ncbi:unnamed protein product [Prorocentrum cordatum]|uniref:Uncharacterized protein n=1 Tax=Prorocentrum cordatum TaxID=2364126 RepID=A0ABN9XNJ2_9DINO|nr:unnamed protein product [Polarella glacialis]
MLIMNIHIEPLLPHHAKYDLMSRAARSIPSSNTCLSFLAGDFNFVEEDDVRIPLDGSEPTVGSTTLARHFGTVFPSFCEIAQTDCTHRTQVRNMVTSVARLDRIYTNAPTGEILDWHPKSGTIGLAHDIDEVSDHIPVYLLLSPGSSKSQSIPRWVSEHPEFGPAIESLIEEVGLVGSPFQQLRLLKDIFFAAREELTHRMFKGGVLTDKQKIAVCLKAMSSIVTGLLPNLKKCVIVIAVEFDRTELNQEFKKWGINIKPFQVDTHGKYLGVMIGPTGPAASWHPVLVKYLSRIGHIKTLKLGLVQNIYACNSLAFPILTYMMQVLPVRPEVIRAETNALQRLTMGPRFAIPTLVLKNSLELGFPVEPRHLQATNKAAMFRVALQSSAFARVKERLHFLEHEDLERLAVVRHRSWLAESMCGSLIKNWDELMTICPSINEYTHDVQRKVTIAVAENMGECDASGMCWHKRTYAEVAKGVEKYQVSCKCDESTAAPVTDGECDASGMCWHKRTYAEVAKGVEKYQVSCKCDESTAAPITDGTDTSDDSSPESPSCDGVWAPISSCEGECDASGMCWYKRTYAEVAKGVKAYQVSCKCDESKAAPITDGTDTPISDDSSPESPSCDGVWAPSSSCEGECDASGMCWYKRTYAEVAKGVKAYQVSCKCDESKAAPITDGTDTSPISDDSSPESPSCDGVWAPSSFCEGECDASGMCWYKRTYAEVAKGVKAYQVSCKCDESTAAPITDGTDTADDSSPESPSCDGVWAPSSSCEGECDASGMCWYKRTYAEVAEGVEKHQVSCKCEESTVSPTTTTTSTTMTTTSTTASSTISSPPAPAPPAPPPAPPAPPPAPSSTSSTTSSPASTSTTTSTVTVQSTTSTSSSTTSSASATTDDDGSPGSARANGACSLVLSFAALLGVSQL